MFSKNNIKDLTSQKRVSYTLKLIIKGKEFKWIKVNIKICSSLAFKLF